ncbi:hypothetical protein HYH03_015621 [Edaphochlamys debaryana]|uniref:Uncharacterized protein n=1 Tax=Edaphochlamys debaryana TaxID=47281 RepID=A0A836BSB3_9CHLO|nr:hypothetical protein HYH03_015621 [Edaphochlamys debaryana]|eukprot:KAG2485649.1 hypothetical protein HYH03_015621 [Edaphochlamys debaryana]
MAAPHDARLPPEPDVPAGLQLARATARTAEALCSLSRGQGLAGAYAAEQQRQMLESKTFLSLLWPSPSPGRPEELPPWAESGAWVLAAVLEELEAAIEEEPTPQAGATAARIAATLVGGVQRVFLTSAGISNGPLTDSQREGIAAHLHRAGLGASLDHALRLAFAAADRAAAPGAAERDGQLAEALGELLPCACDMLAAPTPPRGSASACDMSGVALTLAKRASLIARGLEAAEAADGSSGAVPACLRGPRDSSPGSLAAALARCAPLLKGASEPAAGDGAPEEELEGQLKRELEGELGANFFQAAGRLAAQLGADVAALELTSAKPEDPSPPMSARSGAAAALTECLAHVSALCSAPGRRAQARLLACQPHRLMAVACKLLLAWGSAGADTREAEERRRLEGALSRTTLRLAAHPFLSARVRRWLAPTGQGGAAAGDGASSAADAPKGTEEAGAEAAGGAEAGAAAAGEGADAEQGCLQQAWGEGWRSYDGWRMADGSAFSLPLTLLRLAQGGGLGAQGAEEEADADAAFRSGAMELLACAESKEAGGNPPPPQLPEGLLRGPGDASSPEALHACGDGGPARPAAASPGGAAGGPGALQAARVRLPRLRLVRGPQRGRAGAAAVQRLPGCAVLWQGLPAAGALAGGAPGGVRGAGRGGGTG